MSLQPIDLPGRIKRTSGDAPGRLRGVDQRLPGHRRSERGAPEVEILVVGIHHHKKAFVDVALPAGSDEFAGRTTQNVAERQCHEVVPIVGSRLRTRRGDPGDVFYSAFGEHLSTKKARAREDAMTTPQMYQIANEPSELLVFRSDIFPVEPRDFVVLAIGVIVAALRATDLVAGE